MYHRLGEFEWYMNNKLKSQSNISSLIFQLQKYSQFIYCISQLFMKINKTSFFDSINDLFKG